MSKDIKKALEHCIEWNCADCPNREELGSGETVCRGRLLPEVLEYVADLEAKLAEYEKFMKDNEWDSVEEMQETLNKCEKKYFDIQKQLAEKERQLEKQALFHRKSIKELQNQKAIEQLEQIINLFEPYENEEKDTILCANNGISFLEYIDNQIKQLKELK